MNLDELERLEREATAGPWKHETNAPDGEFAAMWHEHYVYAPTARYETLPGNTSPVKVAWLPQSPTKRPAHDAAFIAALRNAARELIADARRFRWLTEDHSNIETRFKCRELLSRMGVMSYSAACASIDAAIAQEQK